MRVLWAAVRLFDVVVEPSRFSSSAPHQANRTWLHGLT